MWVILPYIHSFPHVHSQDKQVHEWIRTLMKDGQAAIDQFIASGNFKKRSLAEKYQRVMDAAEEGRLAHV